MPRLRGPSIAPPQHEGAWSLLNDKVYGSHDRGGHHTLPMELSAPWSWSEAFGREAPLLLEVGFNRGKFLTDLAKRNPNHNVIGIEIRRRFAWRLSQLLEQAGAPKNLRLLWGDAKILVPALFSPNALQGLFITFPDPWWKKRHFKRRLVDTNFAAEVAQQIKPGGHVWVKTDVKMIADEICAVLSHRPEFGALTPFTQEDLPLTHREVSCLKKGMEIHRFRLTRLEVPFEAEFVSQIPLDANTSPQEIESQEIKEND